MTKTPTTTRTTTGPTGTTASDEALAQLLVGNGIDATTGDYLMKDMDVRQLASIATGGRLEGEEIADLQHKSRRARQTNYRPVEGVDPDDLAQAGWAAVFPAIADDAATARQAAIRDALAPLLSHRRAQATAGDHPLYHAVGRIAFDTIEEYARYAQSVVEAETGQVTRTRRATFFGVANPNDPATRLSADHLVIPLVQHLKGRAAHHGFTVDSHLGDAATRGRLIELLRDPPALLFTASHGMGFPSGDAGQRERQGALLCQDWAGPGKPLAREHYFTGEDLPAQADLRGMIGVLFACYGGGTPTRDEFTRRGLGEAKAKELAPASLIARLPQRMLGHPGGGALAVVGHVDRAWGSTFLWIDAQGKGRTAKHLDVFESMLDSVLAGKRLGFAMESFNLRYAELAADLSERIEQIQLYDEPYEDSELAHMWICNSDARNYAVIGDPAVRIPAIGESVHAPPKRDPITLRSTTYGSSASEMTDDKPEAPAAREDSHGQDVEAVQRDEVERDEVERDEVEREAIEAPSYGWFGGKDDQQPGILAQLGKKLGDVLGNVLGDAAVLEVKTYTSHDLQAVAGGEPLPTSGARLRAYTRCALDGDTDACVPVAADGTVDQTLWALHVEMVKQAQAHRAELLKTVLSLFSPRVKEA